ncbi:DNA repair protein RecN [Fluviispira multicolorata]|uniref:DNA repair protein RecN n=1 Tax=Fluviispira multicolorata TaxID=2654512 RepID=A0A833JD15_9BACT|nr:AAA family ATPase [Fluviispira multicolorata]KAB8031036.1 AAA family ATPase [Fluviispira multicolorata]
MNVQDQYSLHEKEQNDRNVLILSEQKKESLFEGNRMLKRLIIQNLAIAENISVNFHEGLNVITGETGAGKSLIVDALCLLRGQRADTSLIRTGHDSAQVTGIFIPSKKNNFVFSLLEDLGIPLFADAPEEIVIKRFIQRNGRHRATVNENLVSTKILQLISSDLIDISSQFENQRLLDSDSHTLFLDEFCHNISLQKHYIDKFNQTNDYLKQIRNIIQEINLLKREKKLYEFELSQIKNANISKDEFQKLEEVISIGNKANYAKHICQEIHEMVHSGESNCLSQLKYCRRSIEKLLKQNTQAQVQISTDQIDGIIALIEDFIHKTELTENYFEIDELLFNNAEKRIEIYNKILQKFGPTIQDIENYTLKCESYLEKSNTLEIEFKLILEKCETSMKETLSLASKLSLERKNKINFISNSVEQELAELGIPKAKFICSLKDNTNEISKLKSELSINIQEDLLNNFNNLTKYGAEKAQFLLSTNLGIEAQPIEKVASGGELSRIMLAIKNVLFGDDSMSVFIFDEIDTGISGNIASKVGKKLADFCKNKKGQSVRQALCITHLAQVACYSQNHFIVSKIIQNNKTITKIIQANKEEKVTEIAVLLSGETLSQESLAQARFLVNQAQSF